MERDTKGNLSFKVEADELAAAMKCINDTKPIDKIIVYQNYIDAYSGSTLTTLECDSVIAPIFSPEFCRIKFLKLLYPRNISGCIADVIYPAISQSEFQAISATMQFSAIINVMNYQNIDCAKVYDSDSHYLYETENITTIRLKQYIEIEQDTKKQISYHEFLQYLKNPTRGTRISLHMNCPYADIIYVISHYHFEDLILMCSAFINIDPIISSECVSGTLAVYGHYRFTDEILENNHSITKIMGQRITPEHKAIAKRNKILKRRARHTKSAMNRVPLQ